MGGVVMERNGTPRDSWERGWASWVVIRECWDDLLNLELVLVERLVPPGELSFQTRKRSLKPEA